MKYFLIVLALLILSCKSVELSRVKKQVVNPGQPTQSIMIEYGAKLTTDKALILQSISVSNWNEKIIDFVITDLETGVLKRNNEILSKGNYYVSFKLAYNTELAKSEDTVNFNVMIKNKKKSFSQQTEFKD